MATIRVLRPTPESFRKSRPLSGLLRAQIAHFQHIESLLPPERRSNFVLRKRTTEGEAGNYIAYMTGVLQGKAPVELRGIHMASRSRGAQPGSGITLAAAEAETSGKLDRKSPKSKSRKKKP